MNSISNTDWYREFTLDLCVLDQFAEDVESKPMFKIVLMESGSGVVSIQGEKRAFISPCAFFLQENESMRLEKEIGSVQMHTVCFHPVIINSQFQYDFIRSANRSNPMDIISQDLYWLNMFLVRDETHRGQLTLHTMVMKKAVTLVHTIKMRLDDKQDMFWICRSRSYFIELLLFLSQAYQENTPQIPLSSDKAGELVDDIIIYLHANYGKKITLRHIAMEFGTNRTTVNNVFHQMTGDSIITYLIKLRIQVASILLKETNIPIKDISERVGYPNTNNFSRAFKNIAGYPPARYRDTFKVSFC